VIFIKDLIPIAISKDIYALFINILDLVLIFDVVVFILFYNIYVKNILFG